MNTFYSRFRNKTKKELQAILENQADYTQEAIEAAKHLLKLEQFRIVEEQQEKLAEQNRRPKKRRKSKVSAETQIRIYLKGYTRGQFFTLLSLTLFYCSMLEVFYLYSNERSFGTVLYPTLIILIPVVFILNHVFFRIEIKENTYWGRVVSSFFLLSLMIVFRMTFQTIIHGDRFEFDFMALIGVILAMVLMSIVFELLVSLINELLKAFKCPQL